MGDDERDDTRILQLQGDALTAIANEANTKENRQYWGRPVIEPVTNQEGRTLWVKKRIRKVLPSSGGLDFDPIELVHSAQCA